MARSLFYNIETNENNEKKRTGMLLFVCYQMEKRTSIGDISVNGALFPTLSVGFYCQTLVGNLK